MESFYEDIVEFSELGPFMNSQVKNFSSGMISRLAFAIATIGQPDILIVDEVLAVGDAAFQEKCRGRIQELLNKGTTLLFVSHAKQPVLELCEKAVWLDHGEVRMIDTPQNVYAEYEPFMAEKRKLGIKK
jgi:ABC-2 type transport system ATP-binding protein/lipopolysaccharide transport system ATP-binding protein